MTKRQRKNQQKNQLLGNNNPKNLAFIEHVHELRKRLLYIASYVLVGATIAYFIQEQLVAALLRPAHGQKFIFTSPGGGINFLFQVCIYFGIAFSIPAIIYQLLRFIEPVINNSSRKFISHFSVVSGLLALAGIVFGYFMGLPVALKFLTHQFTTQQIQPLFTIQEYMSFVTIYLIGSAFIFQIPLILLFINRIKPMKPKRLFHYERYVIVFAFIAAALMAPTINVMSQLIIAGPIILTYQLGIGFVWLQNRQLHSHYSKEARLLLTQDQVTQDKRSLIAKSLVPLDHEEQLLPTPKSAQPKQAFVQAINDFNVYVPVNKKKAYGRLIGAEGF